MQNVMSDVTRFHLRMGFAPFHDLKFEVTDDQIAEKRAKLFAEELRELDFELATFGTGNMAAVVNETLDVIYVLLGRLVELGFTPNQIGAAWRELQSANMAKVPPEHPLAKGIKPDGWEAPNIAAALELDSDTVRVFVVYMNDSGFGNSIVDMPTPLDAMDLLALGEELGGPIISICPLPDLPSGSADGSECDPNEDEASFALGPDYVPQMREVSELMGLTGRGLHECKGALIQFDGDMIAARTRLDSGKYTL